MKLFALATATAVTARSRWEVPRRVNQPAPGYVNEQGGYWADQPTQQSNQYRQPPQPSFQKPQCCQGYYHDGVFMKQVGENDMKPIYKGDFNGNDMYLFWHFEEMVSTPMFKALPGAWYFGSDFNDPTSATAAATIDSHALRYCPQDQINNWGNGMRFECGQAPQPTQPPPVQQCCDSYDWRTPRGDVVIMRKTGEHDERPVYEGVDMGRKQIMFWRFDEVSDPRPVQAVPGAWYVSEIGVDDMDAIASATLPHAGYRSCPNDQSLGWGSLMNLHCNGRHWTELKTCQASWDEGRRQGIFWGDFNDASVQSECKVERLMKELVKNQMDQLIFQIDDPQAGNLYHQYDNMINKWREMADNSFCFKLSNFKHFGQKGFIPDCNLICDEMQVITTPNDFAGVLTEFAATLDKYFNYDVGYCSTRRTEILGNLAAFLPYVPDAVIPSV